ncbi:MAG: HAMP domain-containing histidine kinase [Proteiniphilum sp.]|jgi:signal transduction histidine kinase|nr:HAMP domain-containing histidine kinase [Proteiniphilum sp.]
MRLIYHIMIRLSVVLSVALAVWAVFFYVRIIDEINDETDDSLEDFAEQIIMRSLGGEELPSESNNSNNQYFLREITAAEALGKPQIRYADSMVYIPPKGETEPARILTTVYRDGGGKHFELLVAIPSIEKKDLKEAILYRMIFLYFALLLCILLINAWVYHISVRPLHRLLAWLNRYRMGGVNVPLKNDTHISEFKRLNEAAVRSMNRSEEVFEEQKQFTGNASHEIQTPLAVCRNRIEHLMEDESLTEAQLNELSKTLHTLEYITRLNRSLLLLSKIENSQFPDRRAIELNAVIKKCVRNCEEMYARMNVRVDIRESGTFEAVMNETLADILTGNIIKNAFVHNVCGGKTEIFISPARLVFRNTGQEAPLDARHIFKRFGKGNSRSESSSGLGLALVKSICDLEKLHVGYAFEEKLHCFEISR